MYTYIFDGVGFKINTPDVSDFSQIKKEIIQSSGKTINRSTYPNGLVLEIEQTENKFIICSNRLLIQNPDGSYTPSDQ